MAAQRQPVIEEVGPTTCGRRGFQGVIRASDPNTSVEDGLAAFDAPHPDGVIGALDQFGAGRSACE